MGKERTTGTLRRYRQLGLTWGGFIRIPLPGPYIMRFLGEPYRESVICALDVVRPVIVALRTNTDVL